MGFIGLTGPRDEVLDNEIPDERLSALALA